MGFFDCEGFRAIISDSVVMRDKSNERALFPCFESRIVYFYISGCWNIEITIFVEFISKQLPNGSLSRSNALPKTHGVQFSFEPARIIRTKSFFVDGLKQRFRFSFEILEQIGA